MVCLLVVCYDTTLSALGRRLPWHNAASRRRVPYPVGRFHLGLPLCPHPVHSLCLVTAPAFSLLPINTPGKMATTTIRKIVSQKKRRFESEGFNLDLSYVTERVIAMGYPASEHVEAMYRNSLEDVRR